MALVDYSDSDSEPETTVQPPPAAPTADATPTTTTKAAAPVATGKKPFQKVIDRSKPGRILVNLPQTAGQDDRETAANSDDQPPAKRARTGAAGRGGAFSGFNSFLPPPKNVGKPATASGASSSSNGKNAPRPGVNLKTGAAPGFSRESGGDDYDELGGKVSSGGGAESRQQQQQQQQQPSIPAGQEPAEEVKLVGKPMMFKPLSVSRRPAKKNANKATTAPKATPTPSSAAQPGTKAQSTELQTPAPAVAKTEPPKKKVSLFSLSNEPDEEDDVGSTTHNETYEPIFGTDTLSTEDAFAQYDAQFAHLSAPQAPGPSLTQQQQHPQHESLDTLASDMNLSAAARRELFGRRGAPDLTGAGSASTQVISFNTDREYAHNEALRASGEQQIYNPVRAIAPGKHNLRQLVNQVHNQREALEESFAQGKSNKNEAMARYGWR